MDQTELPLPTAISSIGLILAVVAGTLSFLSSSFIMITIFRSKQNTQYHRIMFFMSFWDALSSLCILLVTLPMPSNVSDVYDYGGASSFGSVATCSAQGFLLLLGLGMCVLSNMLLNIYYFFAIRYNVSDEKFKKVAEPLFLLCTPLAMVLPGTLLRYDMFNPTPHEPFCFFGEYPYQCGSRTNIECIRGSRDDNYWVKGFYFDYSMIFLGILMAVLFLSMAMIVYTVCAKKVDNEEDVERSQRDEDTQIQQRSSLRRVKRCESKIITMQALMYLTACIIVWGSSILSWFPFFQTTYLFFMPLQGFLNLLIFIYHKVYVLTKVNNDCLDWIEALRLIIVSPKDAVTDGQLVGNIDFVMHPSDHIAQLHHAFKDIADMSATSDPDSNEHSCKPKSVQSGDLSVQNQSSRGGVTNLSGFSYKSDEYATVIHGPTEAQNHNLHSNALFHNVKTSRLHEAGEGVESVPESFRDDDISYDQQSKASHLFSAGLSYGQQSDTKLMEE